jgi:hypothetical protein
MAPSIATKPLEHLLKRLIIRIGLTMARSRQGKDDVSDLAPIYSIGHVWSIFSSALIRTRADDTCLVFDCSYSRADRFATFDVWRSVRSRGVKSNPFAISRKAPPSSS